MRLETLLSRGGVTFPGWTPEGSNAAGPADNFGVRGAGTIATGARSERIH